MEQIRIVEFPRCKAVTSGYALNEEPFVEGGRLMRFMEWWDRYDAARADRWFRRDFLMFGREQQALIWYYALPDGAVLPPDCPYEVVDFEGGLYASAVAVDGDEASEQQVYGRIKEWVRAGDCFDLDERPGHYDLCHVITPESAARQMGYQQLEIYVPIKLRVK